MVSNIKKRRIDRQYYVFFFACLASLIGLFVYILGAKKIPFPADWLPKDSNGKIPDGKLFFSGVNAHLSVNFFLGIFFTLLNTEKMDYIKLKKWKFWINRTLVFLFSLGFGLIKYWNNIKTSWGNILLLTLLITIINCCLLELLIQLMNQYGICNGFNLILLTEFLPYDWIKKNWSNFLPMFLLILLTIFFIWLINLKWEAPIETNTLYNRDSKILKKRRAKLGFRLSLSFMHFLQLSQFISIVYNLVLMRRAKVNWANPNDIKDKWNEAGEVRGQNVNNSDSAFANEDMAGGKFWGPFFLFSDARYIFDLKRLKDWFWNKKLWIISALFFLIFVRWLMAWIQVRKVEWKTGEISKDLRSRGVYINYLAPGRSTRDLLKKVINKVIFFWYFIVLFFNVIFDNIFKHFKPFLSFFNWFGSVNIAVDLFRQIGTKYKYIKTNN